MPNYTAGSTRVALDQPDLTTFQSNGSVVLDNRRVRPYWFDGRFLDARDLEREQDYFLQREVDLGQAEGFQVLTGLMVDQTDANGNSVGSGSFVIHAGEGLTPAGEMVSVAADLTVSLPCLAEQAAMDVQLGLSIMPRPLPKNRTGLYVIGLQPMEHTSNPISSYPTTVQGPRTTHDGDIVETTVVSLIPYPNPPSGYPAGQQQAALARQIFLTGNPSTLPDSLLPLALVSVQQGSISWIDPYLVRRDTGQQYSRVRFGLSDPSAQEAYLLQYDMQLQSIVATRQINGLKANITASDFLQAIPGCGRFPLDAIDTKNFSQVFFPQEMDVRLSIIPSDELPALLEDGLSLPPIDLTLASSAYSSISVLTLIPVSRDNFEALKNSLPVTPINPTLPQVLANRSPMQLLKLYQGAINLTAISPVTNNAWASAISNQQYAFYVRRLSDPTMVPFLAPTGVTLRSSANPSQFGQAVTLTAGLSPTAAEGSVSFLDGTTILGTSPITNGIATLDVSNFSVGTHPITATYAGDSSDAPGASSALTQIVNKATATVSVTSSVNPSTLNQSVTLTATVTPATATGTVQFMNGQTTLGTGAVNISGGAATLAITTLAIGTHTITAIYSGDDNTAAATSAALTQTVNKIPSSVALTSSVNPSSVAQPTTLTATVTPTTAAGTIQFLDGTTALGTGTISEGVATLAVTTLTAGTHSITAVYNGDSNNATSTSTLLTQTVNRVATSVTVTSSLSPSTVAQGVTFTASITPTTTTGTVQFLDGTAVLGAATLSAGTATLLVSTLAVGTHSITAVYSGDTNDEPGTSPAFAQIVNQDVSSVTLSSSLNPSTLGTAVNFVAEVSPKSATGTMQFFDGSSAIGTGTLDSGGKATLTDASLTIGAHSITAAYSGDTGNAASKSATLTQTVNKPQAAIKLSSSVNPSALNQAVTFTAEVSPSTATGNVTFTDETTSLGVVALKGGEAQLTVSQSATGASVLAAGTHTITATYSGDDSTSSIAATLQQTINQPSIQ